MEQILDIKYNFNESNNSVVVSVKITDGYSIEWITNINVNGVDNLEENLIELQNELLWNLYKLGDFYTFIKYEPKRREINALPYRDRVVQKCPL